MHTRDWKFSQGGYVYACNFRDNSTKWIPGKIVAKTNWLIILSDKKI